MRKTGAYISFALLVVVATIITQQEPEGIGAARVSKRTIRPATKSEPRPQGSGGSESAIVRKRPQVSKQLLVESYGRLPLSFEVNHGQTDGSVKFLSRGSGYTLFLTATEAVLALRKPQKSARPGPGRAGEARPALSGAEGSRESGELLAKL